ncbi:MAG: hypothetical protein BGP06_11135 [Rhizobiales bacterium 65-9]|nr:hypothetical protein [Hyphomicrobiales bacterium]OJY32880.1 MAG: hypothetical protein BGP06_11135 [Rhizobiales bacterium 65-9]
MRTGEPKSGVDPTQSREAAASEASPHLETKRLARAAREARILSQIDACKILEKHAFRMAELAREADLSFLVYLFEMARVASVDERSRLGRL